MGAERKEKILESMQINTILPDHRGILEDLSGKHPQGSRLQSLSLQTVGQFWLYSSILYLSL